MLIVVTSKACLPSCDREHYLSVLFISWLFPMCSLICIADLSVYVHIYKRTCSTRERDTLGEVRRRINIVPNGTDEWHSICHYNRARSTSDDQWPRASGNVWHNRSSPTTVRRCSWRRTERENRPGLTSMRGRRESSDVWEDGQTVWPKPFDRRSDRSERIGEEIWSVRDWSWSKLRRILRMVVITSSCLVAEIRSARRIFVHWSKTFAHGSTSADWNNVFACWTNDWYISSAMDVSWHDGHFLLLKQFHLFDLLSHDQQIEHLFFLKKSIGLYFQLQSPFVENEDAVIPRNLIKRRSFKAKVKLVMRSVGAAVDNKHEHIYSPSSKQWLSLAYSVLKR